MDSAIWGLAGTIVGALASMGTTWLASRSAFTLQNERDRVERAERANAFQRQTLLDLQDAIHDALRLVHRAHIEDLKAHRANKEWGRSMLSEEVNEGVRVANRRVSILVERVADDGLRTEVRRLMGAATDVLFSGSEEASRENLEHASSEATRLLERVGAVLRSHY